MAASNAKASLSVESIRPDRMMGIDAARGIAMILVCVSHVRLYFADSAPDLHTIFTMISRLATPTFLLLSGFIAAYVRSSGRTNAQITLIDRGLCVLIVGHLLLNLAELRRIDVEQWMFARVTVTDAIAVCLISTAIFGRLSARVLGALGVLLALISWPVALLWHPQSQIGQYVGAVFFAVRSEATSLIDAAVVPYLGVFLVGMALSRSSFQSLQRKAYRDVARKLLIIGASALGCVLAGIALWHASKGTLSNWLDHESLLSMRQTLDPRSKLPPGPAYLLFYGGGGLLVAAACLICRPRWLMRPVVHWCATLGRASLMCFLVQDWLLKLLPVALNFDNVTSVAFWLAYLVAVLAALHWFATRWDRARGNRWLTVGLRRGADKFRAARAIQG